VSTFSDIADGYKRLQRGTPDYGLIYTCNAGWMDLGHMSPYSKDPHVGAQNLWKQMSAGGPDARLSFWYDYPPAFKAAGYPSHVLKAMKEDKIARIPDGARGFKVTFKMSQPVTGGVVKSFLVRHRLPEPRIKSVALAIFLIMSLEFEEHQIGLELPLVNWLSKKLRDKPYDSGYSQEDLVSNLIGFYVGIGQITRQAAIQACRPVSREAAERIWHSRGAVGQNKNKTFQPDLSADTGFDDPVKKMCMDECAGQARAFPMLFQTIQPAAYSKDFVMLWN